MTGQKTTLIPITAQPSKNIDYLHLPSHSALILGSFTDSCLTNILLCNSGFSLAFWIKITSKATLPQIFLGTSRNNFNGIFVYQTEVIRTERRVIVELLFNGSSWKVPLKIRQEIWDFIVATWNSTNGRLAVYLNGELVNSSVAGNKSDISKLVRLRGNFTEQVPSASLYLESGALYDQFTTRNRSLNAREVKRAFQLQMSELCSNHLCQTDHLAAMICKQNLLLCSCNKARHNRFPTLLTVLHTPYDGAVDSHYLLRDSFESFSFVRSV